MGWSSFTEVTAGQEVYTPHGVGTVKAVSEAQGTVRVDVGGQLFEVPKEQVTASGQTPQPEGASTMIKKGDRVVSKDTGAKGEVTDVTQRTVRVQYANGQRNAYNRKTVFKHVRKDNSAPESQPEGEQPKPEVEQPHPTPSTQEQSEQEKPEEKTATEKEVTDTAGALYGLMHLQKHMEQIIEDNIDEELKELKEEVQSRKVLEIKQGDKTTELEGLKHKQLEQLITYSAMRLSPLLVGMAGTGKTHAGEQVAKALGLNFYAMSVGAQTSKSDIIGYMDANSNYVETHFRRAYEFGGVFLMDEIDAGNANVLIQVNSALSNGLCAFPDKMVERHPDFVFIASANTYGNGANRQYVGRNQLDAATLDRFAIIDWFIDDNLEEKLAVGAYGKPWYLAVKATRDYVSEHNIRALISPRATQKGSKLLDVGQPLPEVINATLLGSVPEDKRRDVTDVATKVFESQSASVPSQFRSTAVELKDIIV